MVCYSKAALLPLSALAAALSLAGLPFVPAPVHAQAQPPTKAPEPPPVQRADPADPKAVTPALVYRSSLSRYQAFTEPDVAPWRETNELVRQRGGWRAYARQPPRWRTNSLVSGQGATSGSVKTWYRLSDDR